MKKQFEQNKRSLVLKKQKIVGLSYGDSVIGCCFGEDPTAPPHTTTKTTTTLGDADAMMIAYIAM